jgi:alanyl-tRNA synthetase
VESAANSAARLLEVLPHEVADAVTNLVNRARDLRKQLSSGGSAVAKPQETVRKVKAEAKATFEQLKHGLSDVGRLLSVAMLNVPQRIEALKAEIATLEKQLAEREAAGPLSGDRLLESAETIGGTTVVVLEVPGVEGNLMRQLIDQVRAKTTSSAVLLASRQGDDKLTIVAGISKDLQAKKLSAGEWIRPVAATVGGGGGGRPDMAQAGGKEPAKLPEALQIAKETIRKMLAG